MPNLILSPLQTAVNRKLPGFQSGKPLKLSFNVGETLSAVLHRFNTYRGPDSQITLLVTATGDPYQHQTQLSSDLTVFVP
jgi:hypothetical protein